MRTCGEAEEEKDGAIEKITHSVHLVGFPGRICGVSM